MTDPNVLSAEGRRRASRTAGFAVLAVATLTLAVGCPPVSPSAPEEGVTDVAMQNIAFQPKVVTIRVGETVRWTNLDSLGIVHTTTSGDPNDGDAGDLWDSGNLSPGESFSRQFNEVGEFDYFCIPHQNMPAMRRAMVIVEP